MFWFLKIFRVESPIFCEKFRHEDWMIISSSAELLLKRPNWSISRWWLSDHVTNPPLILCQSFNYYSQYCMRAIQYYEKFLLKISFTFMPYFSLFLPQSSMIIRNQNFDLKQIIKLGWWLATLLLSVLVLYLLCVSKKCIIRADVEML